MVMKPGLRQKQNSFTNRAHQLQMFEEEKDLHVLAYHMITPGSQSDVAYKGQT